MISWLRRRPVADHRPRITLLDRPGCHLCEVAEQVIRQVADEDGIAWERVDITSSPALEARYAELVPVVLVDGREVAHWSVSVPDLRRALRRRPRR